MHDLVKLVQTTIARRTAQDETLRRLRLALADEQDQVGQLQDKAQAVTMIEQSIQQDTGF